MSGIFGFCGAPDLDVRPVVARMGETLRHFAYHRTVESVVAPGVAIGVHGPGILGQPADAVASPDGQLRLWFVGDLVHQTRTFQGRDDGGLLREAASDAELALAAYRRHGVDGLTRLSGEFLIAVWDGTARELVLVNDRFGLYPHYFSVAQGALVFAPELRPLLCAPGFRARLDTVAVAEFTRFQHLLGDRTWLEGVSMLPYGSVLRYRPDRNRLAVSRYWDWDQVPRLQMGLDESVDRAGELLVSAVTARSKPGERIGVFLSGGLDGRLLAGILSPRRQVDTLTFGHPGCRDVHYADRIARSLGTRHHAHPLLDGKWVLEQMPMHLALTEGFHGWQHMHGISMLEEASGWIDVNLTGWDGGTTFRSRIIEHGRDAPLRHYRDEQDLQSRLFEALCQHWTWPGLTDRELAALTSRTMPGLAGLAFESFLDEVRKTSRFEKDRRADFFVVQQHLRRMTAYMVVTARAALAVRCPYFDYGVVDISYGLPDEIRATPAFFRGVLRRLAPALAWIPYEADLRLPHPSAAVRWMHALPGRTANRLRRLGIAAGHDRPRLYADYEQYLRTDLRAWADGILFDRRTAERGFFDQAGVKALWDRHLSGRELWTIGKVSPLITIEQVNRYLIDGESAESAALGPAGERR